jgi:hypothetical protein
MRPARKARGPRQSHAPRCLGLQLGLLAVQHRGMGKRFGSGTLVGITVFCLAALGAGLGLGLGCGGKAVVDGPPSNSQGGGGAGGTTSTTTTTTTWGTTYDTTTWVTTTDTTTVTTTTVSQCQQACNELFDCTQVDDLCPGISPESGPAFIQMCVGQCEQNPAMIAIVDPNDCPGTVALLNAASPEFSAFCHGGV